MSAPKIDPGEPQRRDCERAGLSKVGSSLGGLSAEEAARRFSLDGPNVLKQSKPVSPLQIFLAQFKSLIIWILIVAGTISGFLG